MSKTETRRAQNREYDARRRAEKPSEKWKKTHTWKTKRRDALLAEPLCRMCAWNGRISASTVVDHVIPHRENEEIFFSGATQALCKPCHDGPKQRAEQQGFYEKVDASGWVERVPLSEGLPLACAETLVGPFRPAIILVTRERKTLSTRSCVQCKQLFSPTSWSSHSTALYCSRRCAKRAGYLRRRTHVDHHAGRLCRWCRKAMPAYALGQMGRSRAWCSSACARRHKRAIDRRVRGAIERGASQWERVDPMVVFEQAAWRCVQCGCAAPRSLMGRALACAPELDHITACWCGGSHTYSNVQLLCRACNLAKAEVEHAAWAAGQAPRGAFDLGPAPFRDRRLARTHN